jgi:serine/threonine-protein kinase
MSERLALGVGETFGAYTIESLLGRGGMGSVFLATQRRLGRKVALKVISPELADDDDFRVRFLRESQLVASLDHPHVIPVYDADEVDGVLYLAMRYVAGSSLRDRIRARGRLAPEETLRIAQQIGGALDAANAAGLVHRDVKPGNILLAEPGEHAYLCDFGVAKRTGSVTTTQAGSFLGSVDYCAPEQIQGGTVDGRADVYSFGCVLFQCLSGELPYRRDTELAVLHAHLEEPPPTLSAVAPELPTSLDAVFATALAKDPEERYATAGDLAANLGRALSGEGADDEATRPAETLRKPAPERRRLGRRGLVLAAAILVVLAVTAVAALLGTRGSGGSGQSPALRTFVDRVENVLAQSADGRSEIRSALHAGFSCATPPRLAGRRVASVADNRESILVQLGTLPAPTDEAGEVVTRLQAALQQSIEADRHYRDGFDAVPTGSRCPLPWNDAFVLAARSDGRATQAKLRFVRAFNPLAERFGRRTWSATGF